MSRVDGDATLILGLGNPLQSDDGLGVRVAEMLADQELPPGVKVEEVGTPGLGLAAWLEGQSRVIIVDAVYMGQSPGTWRRFGPGEVRLIANSDVVSLHEPGLAEALALAQALDALPQEIVFYGDGDLFGKNIQQLDIFLFIDDIFPGIADTQYPDYPAF